MYCILNKVNDCDLRKICYKAWTHFGNLLENFKVFKKILKVVLENFNKNLEKCNKNLKYFLLSILILSALNNLCSVGGRSLDSPFLPEPLLYFVYVTPEI